MAFPTKNVPWPEIARRYEAGESSASVARDYPISRQAIEKRARKEGWCKPTRKYARAVTNTHTAAAYRIQDTAEAKFMVTRGKRTPEAMSLLLEHLECGVSRSIASRAVGIAPDTLTRWMRDDPEFGALVEIAEHQAVAEKVRRIHAAGERGDWRSDAWALERSRLTRDEFNGPQRSDGQITVIINVPRPTTAKAIFEDKPSVITIEGSAAAVSLRPSGCS